MQQQKVVNDYLLRTGINPERITSSYVEKVSGTVKHDERKLATLLKECKTGDYIYISELSRLGRNMSDLFAIITECSERGITVTQCKDGTVIENESIGGKALLFALSLAAEIEVANIRQRTKAGLDARKELLRKNGSFVSKSGNVVTKLGRERGCDLTKAREASAKAKQEIAALFRMNNKGYQSVKRWLAQGMPTAWILEEFNEHHKADPENYSTMTGKPLTESTLKQWRVEINNAVAV